VLADRCHAILTAVCIIPDSALPRIILVLPGGGDPFVLCFTP